MLIERSPTPRSNWTRSDTAYASVVVTPQTEAELVAIVQNAADFPSPVRAAGHLHSTNPCFCTNVPGSPVPLGTLVLMGPVADREGRASVSGFGGVEVFHGVVPGIPGPDVYVRAGAGARMIDIRNALRSQPVPGGVQRELAVSPEIGNATAGSVACGGTKDSTLNPRSTVNLGQISSLVVEAKLVDANGNKILVHTGESSVIQQNGDLLPLPDLCQLRSSYGLLGILYEVTFRTAPLVEIETRYEWVPFPGAPRPRPADVPDIQADIFKGADGVLGFLQPYDGGMIVERRTRRAGEQIPPPPGDTIRRALRDWMWEWGASEATTAALAIADLGGGNPDKAVKTLVAVAIESALASTTDNPLKQLLRPPGSSTPSLAPLLEALGVRTANPLLSYPLSRLAQALERPASDGSRALRDLLYTLLGHAPGALLTALGGFTGYRSDSMIDFASDRATHFDFTFWAFPLDSWRETVSAYFGLCDDIARSGFRPSLFTEVYFIGRDTSSFLSPSPGGPVFTLDTVHSGAGDAGWRTFNESYNLWAAEHGGRPLLNQTKHLESTRDVKRDVLQRAFGADWATFSNMVTDANPPRADAPRGRFVSDFFARLL